MHGKVAILAELSPRFATASGVTVRFFCTLVLKPFILKIGQPSDKFERINHKKTPQRKVTLSQWNVTMVSALILLKTSLQTKMIGYRFIQSPNARTNMTSKQSTISTVTSSLCFNSLITDLRA
jgi:hypothetical protein